MCFPLFSCFKSWLKPGRLLASYYMLHFYKKTNMNLFKLVDKMHDKLLFCHYLHCTAYQCWRPGFPNAIYSTGNMSRKNLLWGFICVFTQGPDQYRTGYDVMQVNRITWKSPAQWSKCSYFEQTLLIHSVVPMIDYNRNLVRYPRTSWHFHLSWPMVGKNLHARLIRDFYF